MPWGLIAFGATGTGWGFWVTEIIMGFGLAGIGLNVMHDANHGAFSSNKRVNAVIGKVLDLVGGNSAMWKIQHNVLHHSFTIEGLDEDIDLPASCGSAQTARSRCTNSSSSTRGSSTADDPVLDDRERLDGACATERRLNQIFRIHRSAIGAGNDRIKVLYFGYIGRTCPSSSVACPFG